MGGRAGLEAFYEARRELYAGTSDEASSSHMRIVSFLPAAPPVLDVLDVGCAAGGLGARIRRSRGHRVHGLEISESAARAAREVLDDVRVGDVESMSELPWPPGSFDVLLFADVLEHTVDPRAVLARMLPLLRPGGFVLISVPNFGFFRIRLRFLLNRVEYEPSGILDEGHLRIMNERLLRKLVRECGLVLEGMRGAGSMWTRRLPLGVGRGPLGRVIYPVERIVKGALPNLLYSQLVARARPAAREER